MISKTCMQNLYFGMPGVDGQYIHRRVAVALCPRHRHADANHPSRGSIVIIHFPQRSRYTTDKAPVAFGARIT